MNRRDFLKTGSLAALGAGMLGAFAREAPASGLERRPLGRTGHLRSVVTLGGIVVMNETQADADRVVAEAIDAGVNGVDVAPTYGDAELKLGQALRGRRDQVFLAAKTTCRDRNGAGKELEASLKRLQTDYVDLYQLHGLDKPEDWEKVKSAEGALGAFEAAREKGLVRFLGITGHVPATLLTAIREYNFATVMFPRNFIMAHHGYGEELLAEATRQGLGVLAIKPIAERRWAQGEARTCPKCWYRPFTENEDIHRAVCWALAQPVTTIIPSGDMRLFRRVVKAAQHYRALTESELAAMEAQAAATEPLWPV